MDLLPDMWAAIAVLRLEGGFTFAALGEDWTRAPTAHVVIADRYVDAKDGLVSLTCPELVTASDEYLWRATWSPEYYLRPIVEASYRAALVTLRDISLVSRSARDGVRSLSFEIYRQLIGYCRVSSDSNRLSGRERKSFRPDIGLARILPARWYFLAICDYYADETTKKRRMARKQKHIARVDISRQRSRPWLALTTRCTARRKEMRRLAASANTL